MFYPREVKQWVSPIPVSSECPCKKNQAPCAPGVCGHGVQGGDLRMICGGGVSVPGNYIPNSIPLPLTHLLGES